MGGLPPEKRRGEVLFEYLQLGPQMRIAAVDVATGVEVVVIAPLSATQQQMQHLALNKLKHRLGQIEADEKGAGQTGPSGKFA